MKTWIAKTDPTNVMLTRTPESAEEELSKLKEKMEDLTPNLSSDIDADTKFAQMESRLIDYTKNGKRQMPFVLGWNLLVRTG